MTKLTDELKSHFLNMYLIAMSDSDFDENEMKTIIEIGISKGITQQEFEKFIINPANITFKIPKHITQKMEYLHDFARIIWADGKVDKNERITLNEFCLKFGFDTEASVELTEWLLEIAKKNLSHDQLHHEIDKLLNS